MNSFNPFDGFGNIIYGDRFIGRADALQSIKSRIVTASEPGNLAIIGNHRMGKSSLIYHVIMKIYHHELYQLGRIPVQMNVAKYDNQRDFFVALATKSYDNLQELNLITDPIENAINRVKDSTISDNELFYAIEKYFKKVRQSGKWIIFILDEFDHARILFKNSISGFQRLRSLSYDDPDGRVTFVTASRRSIREIEEQTHSISTFDGIFYKIFLNGFDQDDIEIFYSWISKTALQITPDMRQKIHFYCGEHPYFLSMLGYKLIDNHHAKKNIDIDHLMVDLSPHFIHLYDRMFQLMDEDNRLVKLVQVIDPLGNITQDDIRDLSQYGLLKRADDSYQLFSQHFQDYIKFKVQQLDLWSIWKKTEIAMRNFISRIMQQKYSDKDWITETQKEKPNIEKIFKKCRENQEKDQKSFGDTVSTNILDYTYPSDLFDIIFAYWSLFSPYLGHDKQYWEQRKQLLSRSRNLLAHNRDNVLQPHERAIAEAYCQEILSCIEKV